LLSTATQIFTAIAPVPAAALAERTGSYKANVIVPNLVARAGFFALIALPFFQIGQDAVGVAIAIFAMRAFMQSWSIAPWTAFVGKLVPLNIRANYFAARNFVGGIASIVGALLAGQIIASLGYPGGFQVAFIISLVVGMGATITFWRIPFKEDRPALNDFKLSELRRTLIPDFRVFNTHTPFGRFLICSCALAFAVNIGGPFIGVYQVKVLGFTAATLGVLVSIEQGMNIIMQRVYGSTFIPRFGNLHVMRVLRFLTALVPLAWALGVNSPIAAIPIVLIAGSIWSGHELANFNVLLEITPEHNRASAIAVYTFAVSIFTAIGPAIGGILSDLIGYQPLFALSAILRIAAAILFTVLVKKIK
jgi:MFS family permease